MAGAITKVLNTSGSHRWDYGGVTVSMLCIAHCIAAPALVAWAPVLAATEHQTHIALSFGLFFLGLLAFLPAHRRHGRIGPALTAVLGFAMLVSTTLLPAGGASEFWETALTVAGGAFLITAHLTNVHYCRRCRRCGATPCLALADTD